MIPSDLIPHVRALAAERPGFAYDQGASDRCSYAPDDHNPLGCIVGAAVARANPKAHAVLLHEEEESGNSPSVYAVFDGRLPDWFATTHDDPALTWLSRVQGDQDSGAPWSAAVRNADAMVPLP